MKNYLSKTKKMLMLASCLALFVFVACNDNNNDPQTSDSSYYYRIGKEGGENFSWPVNVRNKVNDSVVPYYSWSFVLINPIFYDDLSELENYVDSLTKIFIPHFEPTPPFLITDYELITQYFFYKIHRLTGEEEKVVATRTIEFE